MTRKPGGGYQPDKPVTNPTPPQGGSGVVIPDKFVQTERTTTMPMPEPKIAIEFTAVELVRLAELINQRILTITQVDRETFPWYDEIVAGSYFWTEMLTRFRASAPDNITFDHEV
jgi:hypothetical protein